MSFKLIKYPDDKKQMYRLLKTQLTGLVDGVPHRTANLANASALIWQALTEINWAGFYFIPENYNKLVLGPFQGLPACIEIEIGKGVCGTAVAENAIQLVADVHQFPGHIACDSASNSEIVLPIHDKDGKVIGVLDIDSPVLNRFDEDDKNGLAELVKIIEEM